MPESNAYTRQPQNWPIYVFVIGLCIALIATWHPAPSHPARHHSHQKPRTDVLSRWDDNLLGRVPETAYKVTWYDGKDDGLNGGEWTSTGVHPKANRTVAVDPRTIPYGSWIEVVIGHNVQFLRAEDTGGSIVGRRLDIFNPSRAACLVNGRQVAEVAILVRG